MHIEFTIRLLQTNVNFVENIASFGAAESFEGDYFTTSIISFAMNAAHILEGAVYAKSKD